MPSFILLQNVKVMAHPLAGASVDRGVRVVTWWEHLKQRGWWVLPCTYCSLLHLGVAVCSGIWRRACDGTKENRARSKGLGPRIGDTAEGEGTFGVKGNARNICPRVAGAKI